MMKNKVESVTALALDQKGMAYPISLDALTNQPTWIHLDYSSADNKAWLMNKSGLSEVTYEALIARETRPRTMIIQQGILLILRTVNSNPKAEWEDMISLRIWIEGDRLISASKRQLPIIKEIQDLLKNGHGPKTLAECLTEIAERITDQISEQINKIDIQIDALEDEAIGKVDPSLRTKLATERSHIIALKRYVAPQRDALSRLTLVERFAWLTESDRLHLLETADRTIRCLEDLEEAKDRATIVQETLSNRLSERVEQRMYILSTVAAIFLPLSFITGLLGINVNGIPGAETKGAFAIVSITLLFIAFFEFWLFKKKQWF